MANKKHRAGGRFTPPKGKPRPQPGEQVTDAKRVAPQPSARFTPATQTYRVRPKWHRVAGWGGVLFGILLAAVNDLMLMGEDVRLLPGGHSELYLMLGISVAGGATWFLGLFDRGTTIYE